MSHDAPSRRAVLGWAAAGLAGAAGVTGAVLLTGPGTGTGSGSGSGAPGDAPAAGPFRPPAVPLAVRSPYLSTWLPADRLPGSWPTFWTGRRTAMVGIARLDGRAHVFLGDPALPGRPALPRMRQRALTVTATRSTFVLEAAGVELTVTFHSPVEPGDLRRQSMPLSYLTCSARSTDGRPHPVDVYLDISAEWAVGDPHAPVRTAAGTAPSAGGTVRVLSCSPATPRVLTEQGDTAGWGSVVWSTVLDERVSWQIGTEPTVRAEAVDSGRLRDSAADVPAGAASRPVLALHRDLGTVYAATAPFVLAVGHVRTPAVRYLGTPLPPLWADHFPDWRAMIGFFHDDQPAAVTRAERLDRRVSADATRAGGPACAALCALALRQAYGGTELVSRDGRPWALLKEISSDGNVSTVDVIYPSMPVWLHLDPDYLGLLLAPLLDYAERGGWPERFAAHDLGSSYPDATGHDDGREENMPVEESANMLIMSAAYLARTGRGAGRWARAHRAVLEQWADYLRATALDPGYQNQTDDFTGFIAHSVNLALKGIIGIAAMGQVAAAAGDRAGAARRAAAARSSAAAWRARAVDTDATHLRLAYDRPGSWSLKYNGYADTLLGTGLVPGPVTAAEAAWYLSRAEPYGVPLDERHSYTKADWELWTAAWLHGHPRVAALLVDRVRHYLDRTPSRVPFSDWYDTVTARQVGFRARPVVGAVFAPLTVR